MDLPELGTLLDYHYWARDRILTAAGALTTEQYTRRVESSFPSVRDTLVHVYSADWVWARRWHGDSPAAPLEPAAYPDVPSLSAAWSALEREVRSLVTARGEAGIEQAIEYRNFAGISNAQPFWQLVHHMVNHASYHRGQATTLMRQVGGAPPKPLDLVAFYRDKAAAS